MCIRRTLRLDETAAHDGPYQEHDNSFHRRRDADNRIPLSKYVALMRAGKELCNDPALALHFGETVDASELSIAHAVGGAANFGDALAVGNRYAPLAIEVESHGTGDRFQLRRLDGALWLVDTRANPNAFPELTESAFARMVCTVRRAAGEHAFVTAVHVSHAEPAYRAEYERIFRVPVVFGSDKNALRIDEALLSRFPFPASSRYATGVLRDHAEGLLERLERSQPTRQHVERLLMPMLQTKSVSVDAVGRAVGLSRQTLFRRLRAEGTTFEQVLDEVRRTVALDYLGVKKASVKQTALLVGYSDASAFSRAFKRWTGFSPRAYASRRDPPVTSLTSTGRADSRSTPRC